MRGSVLGPHPSQPTSPPTRCSPEPPPCCVPLTVPPGRLAEVEAVLGAAVREHLPGGAEHPAGRQPLTDRTQRPQRSHWGWKGGGGAGAPGAEEALCRRALGVFLILLLLHLFLFLLLPLVAPLRPGSHPPRPHVRRFRAPRVSSAPAGAAPGGCGEMGGGRGRARPLAAASRARPAGRCSRRCAILWGQPVTAPHQAQRGPKYP